MSDYEKIVKMWRGFKIRSEADLAAHLDSFRVLFAYNSNKIENGNTTYEDTYEVFEHDRVINYTGDTRTIVELKNQKRVFLHILEAFGSRMPIDEAFVRGLQFIITEGTYDESRLKRGEHPGEYKKHHYVVGESETGAAPETVKDELVELLNDLNSTSFEDDKLLMATAYLHAKFENIHPFSDGNGRTGRILMNYFLIRNDHPPITIYDENRLRYYAALEAFHTAQDLCPLRELLEAQAVKTWEKTLQRTHSNL
jgi:Fic family protein